MTVWFVVPAHGRLEQSAVCLRLLADTCATLTDAGVEATAVVIADDENIDVAHDLGFATVVQNNDFLGRKLNDGFQLACDPHYNPRPADVVIPFGSDDWIDPQLILTGPQPKPGTIVCHRQVTFVHDSGARYASLRLHDRCGVGVRSISGEDVARAGYRPCAEDAYDRSDLSTHTGLGHPRPVFHELHPFQIVDWKTAENVWAYESYVRYQPKADTEADPFVALADYYPRAALDGMRGVYGIKRAKRKTVAA